MERTIFRNLPLLEAIFQIKWEINELDVLNYQILVGQIYKEIQTDFPFQESLETAKLPFEACEYIIQHRFRKNNGGYPLVQIGPGTITVNITKEYKWDEFRNTIIKLISILKKNVPKIKDKLEVSLKYINVLDKEYQKIDLFIFLKENLNIEVNIEKQLFSKTGITPKPLGVNMQYVFETDKVGEILILGISNIVNQARDKDMLAYQLSFNSTDIVEEKLEEWLDRAHKFCSEWFFGMLKEDFGRRFE